MLSAILFILFDLLLAALLHCFAHCLPLLFTIDIAALDVAVAAAAGASVVATTDLFQATSCLHATTISPLPYSVRLPAIHY